MGKVVVRLSIELVHSLNLQANIYLWLLGRLT